MFSQLTALAKSATDFSLDNLQEDENDTKKSSAESSQENKVDEAPAPEVSSSEESTFSASRFTNLFDMSSSSSSPSKPSAVSSTTSTEVESASSSSTSTFGSLFSSAPTITSTVSAEDLTAGSTSAVPTATTEQEKSAVHDTPTSEITIPVEKEKEQESRNDLQLSVSESLPPSTTTTTSSATVEKKSGKSPDKAAKSPAKSKKGSGREAAKQLELKLRQSLAEVEAALKDKTERLDQVTSRHQQEMDEAAEHASKLQTQLSSLETTVSELEESNIDTVTQKEALEVEVESLRREAVLQSQHAQELRQQVHDLTRTLAEGGSAGEGGDSTEGTDSKIQQQEEKILQQQESLQSLQQALDAQASQHAAQLIAAEKVSEKKEREREREKDRTEKQEQTLTATITSLQARLKAQEADMEALREAHKVALQEREEKHCTSLAQVEDEKNSLEASLEQVEQENANLKTALELLQGDKHSLEADLQQRVQQGADEASRSAALLESRAAHEQEQTQLIQELQEKVLASDTKYSELKEKFSQFTEKTKVQVKKFIESQKASDEEKRAAASALEVRDSEITSLRLKLDTIDHSLSDRKAKSSELAERYSELQREMQRRRDELTSKDALAEDLQRRLTQQEEASASQFDDLTSRLDAATAALVEAKRQASSDLEELSATSAQSLSAEQLGRMQDREESAMKVAEAQRLLAAAEDECEVLRNETRTLEERVAAGLGSKKTLEDYKQRAQKAVKQANTASAALSAKLAQAEERLESLEQQLAVAEEGRVEGLASVQALEATLETERSQSREQEQRREALEAKSSELQSEVLSLQASLTTAIEEAKAKAKVDLKKQREQTEQREQREQLQDLLGGEESQDKAPSGGSRGGKSGSSMPPPHRAMRSSDNKTAVVVPVRQAAGSSSSSTSFAGGGHTGKSVDYYSNDSDCVLVKDDTLEFIEIDGNNAQSDVENGGNVSENSSVVVQWKNILHRPRGTSPYNPHSPGSDEATDMSSPTNNAIGSTANDSVAKGNTGNPVPKVESLLSITSCSSVGDQERGQEHEDEGDSSRGDGRVRGGQDYFLVQELKRELHQLRHELSNSHMVAEDLRRDSSAAEEARAKAVRDFNELQAFHERTKKLLNSPDSAMNIEYLKKCIFRLMATKEVSERSRLYPVISALLKFTPEETREVTAAIQEEVAASESLIAGVGVSPATWLSASSSLGGLFGGGAPLQNGTVTSTGEVEIDDSAASGTNSSTSSSWW